MSKNKYVESWVSTRDFCKRARVVQQTVHAHHSRVGHYYGIKPRKQVNGRLQWPLHEWQALEERLLTQGGTEGG